MHLHLSRSHGACAAGWLGARGRALDRGGSFVELLSMPSNLPRLDDSRRAMLQADLALTPTERVLAAERTAREVPVRRYGALFVSFDRFEDYLDWKCSEALGDR